VWKWEKSEPVEQLSPPLSTDPASCEEWDEEDGRKCASIQVWMVKFELELDKSAPVSIRVFALYWGCPRGV
jgi:hypothetical protein